MTTQGQHTPGPWFIQRTTAPEGFDIRKETPDCESCDRQLTSKIAVAYTYFLAPEHGGTVEANARLMAVAPDLFAALLDIRDWVGPEAEWGPTLARIARVAIDKIGIIADEHGVTVEGI